MDHVGKSTDSVVRDRIMAAARRRFEKFGYRATSIALVARDAGIAVGTVYLYFKNKEEILVALFDESNSRWTAEARGIAAQPGTAEERLLRIAHASTERYQRDELLRAVMTRDLEIILAPLCEGFREKVLQQNVDLMAEIIADGVKAGEIRPIDPRKAALVLWTAADALFMQRQHRYEELLPVFVTIVRDGLRDASGTNTSAPSRRKAGKARK